MNEQDIQALTEIDSPPPMRLTPMDPFSFSLRETATSLQQDVGGGKTTRYGFKVSHSMYVAKEKLRKFLKDNPNTTGLSLDDITEICGTQRVRVWMEKYANFLIWFIDLEHEAIRREAYREQAIDVVMKVMTSRYQAKVLTAKDKLKAAEMMLQITDTFPRKEKETKIQDRELENMDSEQRKSEIKKLRETLMSVKEKG